MPEKYVGTVVRAENNEMGIVITVVIPKPEINLDIDEKDIKAVKKRDEMIKGANEFVADVGLGQVEVRYTS